MTKLKFKFEMAGRTRRGRSERNEELELVREELREVRRELRETTHVDPHFSRASPLDQLDSVFICEKLIFRKVGVATYFIFILKEK